jgi:alpha-galactosidase
MVDSNTYPDRAQSGGYDLYSELMTQFIHDVRKDFDAPKMKFVIGVMGVGGLRDKQEYFREAMAAPAKLPQFKGNVAAVETAPFWDKKLGEIDGKLV